jgi:hypothetical protein
MSRLSRLALLAACSGLLPSAFAQNAAPASAAIVAGADVYFNFDMAAARKSPLFLEIEAKNDEPEINKKMKDATGLDKSDLLRFSGSVDIDGINFEGEPTPEQMAALPFVMGLQLAKSVTRDQFKKGLELSLSEQPGTAPKLSDAADGLVKISKAAGEDEKPSQPMFAGLAADGKNVFVSVNEKSVKGAIARSASGKLEALPAGLAAMAGGASHFQVAVLLPQVAKDGIGKAIDDASKDPGAVMVAGMLAPLKGLSKVAIKANFNPADLALSFAADLGKDDAAAQATMMLNTMVMPMLAQSLGQDPTKPARITVANQGTVLTLKGSMTKDELMKMGESAGAGLPEPDADEPEEK